MPTNARVYPSGAALTHPTLQSYVLSIGAAFAVAVGLPVAVVLIVEHAVNGFVLVVLVLVDEVDVTNFVELDEGTLVESLVDVEVFIVLEVAEEITIDDELGVTAGGPVFIYRSSLGAHG